MKCPKCNYNSPVPEPGTTFTVEEIMKWLKHISLNELDDWPQTILTDPEDGIAAVTERKA